MTSIVTFEAWGDMACFTRPEAKVERVSYPVITPSAARGLVEAICWRPEMHWIVERIEILAPVKWISMGRNEVNSKISQRAVTTAAKSGPEAMASYSAIEDHTPRATLALGAVRYRITVRAVVLNSAGGQNTPAKYAAMLARRIDRGQCFRRPYFGCREFAADFGPASDRTPIDLNADLGLMLYDIDYGSRGQGPVDSAVGPMFFRAEVRSGSIDCAPSRVLSADDAKKVLGC